MSGSELWGRGLGVKVTAISRLSQTQVHKTLQSPPALACACSHSCVALANVRAGSVSAQLLSSLGASHLLP